jgi:hypothetical protein
MCVKNDKYGTTIIISIILHYFAKLFILQIKDGESEKRNWQYEQEILEEALTLILLMLIAGQWAGYEVTYAMSIGGVYTPRMCMRHISILWSDFISNAR